MKSRKHRASRRRPPAGAAAPPCTDWHADDGVPPERLFRKPFNSRRHKPDRKLLQLCGQVRRTLSCVLAGECGDPLLQDLLVDSVEPAPDASRLRVTVHASGMAAADVPRIHERLERAKGLLRREVAAAIVRKRAPELVFHVLHARPGGEVRP